MKILCDLDDTLIDFKNRIHPSANELLYNHEVILYSASDDIKSWANHFKVDYISKHDHIVPEADVLIDDDDRFKSLVKTKYYFRSIDEFLESNIAL